MLHLIFLQISELTLTKQPLKLSKPTRNAHKTSNKLMIFVSGELNFQSKHHVVKVKAATSAHSMADLRTVCNFCFESKALIKPKI